MEIINETLLPNFRYYTNDKAGNSVGTVIAKATFKLLASGRLVLAEEQAPMLFTDQYNGAVNQSSIWHPSDLVSYKPKADIIINGNSYSPLGKPSALWLAGIEIYRYRELIFRERLRVCGPRNWMPEWQKQLSKEETDNWQSVRNLFVGWKLSEPIEINRVSLCYENAFGGSIVKGVDETGNVIVEAFEMNPLGSGYIDPVWTDHTKAQPAPQIERADEPVTEAYKPYRPAGVGAIPPAWQPRRRLGGTYDEKWMKERWPGWPEDYDTGYNNSSPLQTDHLHGNETFRLVGMSSKNKDVWFRLPDLKAGLEAVGEDGGRERLQMNLDTVIINVTSEKSDERFVIISWRGNFEPDSYEMAYLTMSYTQPDKQAIIVTEVHHGK